MPCHVRFLMICLLLAFLSACAASGPTFNEASAAFAPLKPSMGRIYFYRPANFMGGAIRPDVVLDGETVGTAIPEGFFYVDREAGNHEAVLSSGVEKRTTIRLAAGESRYVRIEMGLGVVMARVFTQQVDAKTGQREIESLHYTGN